VSRGFIPAYDVRFTAASRPDSVGRQFGPAPMPIRDLLTPASAETRRALIPAFSPLDRLGIDDRGRRI